MRLPFPGMDPWLEQLELWSDVHASLIAAIRDALAPLVLPRYFVGVELRTTVLSGLDIDLLYRPDISVLAAERAGPPRGSATAVLERTDVAPVEVVVPIDEEEIEETFLTINELPGRKLVTVIEVLSPTNKGTRNARSEYLDERRSLIRSKVNFVEIDLLRGGEAMPLLNPPEPSDYRIMVCRAGRSRHAVLYPFSWRSPIPAIPIPLMPGDAEPVLDLNHVAHSLMDRARYDLVIDYSRPPEPPLRPGDDAWVKELLARTQAHTGDLSAGKENGP